MGTLSIPPVRITVRIDYYVPRYVTRIWYCGWCANGPFSLLIDAACLYCHRHRDQYSNFQLKKLPHNLSYVHTGPDPRFENLGTDSVSAADTASETETSATALSVLFTSQADSVSSKNLRVVAATNKTSLLVASNDQTLPQEQSSWEQKAASPDISGPLKDLSANLSEGNVSQLRLTGKQSWLEECLSVNPEDPWNSEWVVYAARTPLPGEFSYSLETGQPATTSRRRPYNLRRRAEVASLEIMGVLANLAGEGTGP